MSWISTANVMHDISNLLSYLIYRVLKWIVVKTMHKPLLFIEMVIKIAINREGLNTYFKEMLALLVNHEVFVS